MLHFPGIRKKKYGEFLFFCMGLSFFVKKPEIFRQNKVQKPSLGTGWSPLHHLVGLTFFCMVAAINFFFILI